MMKLRGYIVYDNFHEFAKEIYSIVINDKWQYENYLVIRFHFSSDTRTLLSGYWKTRFKI